MRFYEYKTLWEEVRGEVPRHVTEEVFYSAAMGGGIPVSNGLVAVEGIWKRLRRPYYQVWPAIVPALLKLRLDLDARLICTPMRAMVMRLPADKPIDELPGVQTAIVYQEGPGSPLRLWVNVLRPTGLVQMHTSLSCEPGKTLEQSLQESLDNTPDHIPSHKFISQQHLPLLLNCLRLCATLCLLADDLEVITPDVLADDRRKYEAGGGEQKYVDRAHRRGKLGWNVGEKIEVTPHYRRSHPALVWTGHGRAVPRIIMRKGSVVHREVLVRVPTGFANEHAEAM